MAQKLEAIWRASGANKSNAASRLFTPLEPAIAQSDGRFRTISEISRVNGMWADPGGADQSLTIECQDHLIDSATGETIASSLTASVTCAGGAPSQAQRCTTVLFPDAQQSRAAVAAWSAGTLRIVRTARVTEASSEAHGPVVFRSGVWEDVIAIRGSTASIAPRLTLSNFRLADEGVLYASSGSAAPFQFTLAATVNDSSAWETDSIYKQVELRIENLSGGSPPVSGGSAGAVVQRASNAASWTLTQADFNFTRANGGFQRGARYRLSFTMMAGNLADSLESATIHWEIGTGYVPMHFNRYGNGLGIGQYSSVRAAGAPGLLDVGWRINANAGINGLSNYALGEVATGGSWTDGKPVYRYLGSVYTSSTGVVTSLVTLPFSVDALIRLEGVMVSGLGRFPLSALGINASYDSCLWMPAGNTLGAMIGSAHSGTKEILFILEYTKT